MATLDHLAAPPYRAGAAPRARRLLILLLAVVAPACAGVTPRIAASPARPESTVTVPLHGADFHIHLASAAPASPALVLYASGDGGWFGTAIDMWRLLSRDGVIAAGFSARAFLKLDRPHGQPLDPARLAGEYRDVVTRLRDVLRLPADAPVILAGWSRGAAFSVLAAAERQTVPALAGVIAIGLAGDEDLAIDGPADESDDGDTAAPSVAATARAFDPYQQITRVPVPVAVIQATHDDYFPAAAARARFGPDRSDRRFLAVEAKNHRFAGGTAAFDAALHEAVQWVLASYATSRRTS